MSASDARRWRHILEEAQEIDSWGQNIEAIETYDRLITELNAALASTSLSSTNRSLLERSVAALKLRIQDLKPVAGRGRGLEARDIRKLEQVFSAIQEDRAVMFPIDLSAHHVVVSERSEATAFELEDEVLEGGAKSQVVGAGGRTSKSQSSGGPSSDRGAGSSSSASPGPSSTSVIAQGGNLLPPPSRLPSKTYLIIDILKIGLKDWNRYLDPFVTVSVRSSPDRPLEPPQETPYSTSREFRHLVFNNKVFMQTPLEDLSSNAAIFLELKHYKPKKKKVSTRCFSFMEMDEIRDGHVALELYRKPTDFSRKKLKLFTIKQLYFNLFLTLQKA